MIPEERRKKIVEKLKEKDIYTIDDLRDELDVSRITVQRDINILFDRGLVDKIHGGVRLKKEPDLKMESRFSMRMHQNLNSKKEIALKAVGFVKDESNIFLDSSTTVYTFFRELRKKKFQDTNIITTSPSIICNSMDNKDLKIISTGGELRTTFKMLAGHWVIEFLDKININSAFISAAGITSDGRITSNNRELANTINTVFSRTEEINLLVDSSKFFKSCMVDISSLSKCRRIITDRNINKETLLNLRKIKGPEIIY